jgi:hypothetical protein
VCDCAARAPALSASGRNLRTSSGARSVRSDRLEQTRTFYLLRYVRNICKIAIDIIDELDTTSIDCAKNGHFVYSEKREKEEK